MKRKKPYEPPKIIDLKVDYTQAVGASQCATGSSAVARCQVGRDADSQCYFGQHAGVSCTHGPAG